MRLPGDVRDNHASVMTLRDNVTLCYEQLDLSKLLPLVSDRFDFTKSDIKEVESYYDHPRAQAATILLVMRFAVNLNIPSLCTLIESIEGMERLSSQLIKGKLYMQESVLHVQD